MQHTQVADRITRALSAFDSFADLIAATIAHGYRPTIHREESADHALLASLYDMRMKDLGLTTRAYPERDAKPAPVKREIATHAAPVERARKQPIIMIGLPVTYSAGSDCYPARVASVSKSQHMIVLDNGMKYSRRADGAYRMAGAHYARLSALGLGFARYYQDPSF